MNFCLVHDEAPKDYDSRGTEYRLPTLEELEEELIEHLRAIITGDFSNHRHDYGVCGHCYEEWYIQTPDNPGGVEELMLEEDHIDRYCEEECTCPEGSPNRMYFLQQIRHTYRKVTA